MKNVFKWITVLLAAGVVQSGFGADRSVAKTVFGDVTKRLTPPVVEPLSTDLPIHEMRAGFVKPPSSAKAKVWWHWMNGNVTREGITADLEAMKHAGVGGAMIFEFDCGIQPVPKLLPGYTMSPSI